MKEKKHKIKQDPELWKKLDEIRSNFPNFQENPEYKKLRSALADINYPIVIKLAELMHHKYKDSDRGDLQGFGSLGLLDAIDKFDPYKDIQFETFASYRIFGSMYDEMRKLDWVPRLTRQRHSKMEKIREKFFLTHGRAPTREELMEFAPGDTELEKEKTVDDSNIKISYSINKVVSSDDDDDDFSSIIHFKNNSDALVEIDRKDMFMNKICKDLDEKESKFIYLVYYEGRSLKEAAQIAGIKENKSSSVHDAALKKLKEAFKKDKELLTR
jgi:RNA polymerase sigma factor FliA